MHQAGWSPGWKALIGEAGYGPGFRRRSRRPLAFRMPPTGRGEWLELGAASALFRRAPGSFAGAAGGNPTKGGHEARRDRRRARCFCCATGRAEIRAFHNVCRHRGAQLVTAPCRKRQRITCPYHAWSLRAERQAAGAATFQRAGHHRYRLEDGGGPDARSGAGALRGLERLHLRQCLGRGAGRWLDWLAPLLERCAAAMTFHYIRWAGKLDFEVAANWKLVYENYMEGYHVFCRCIRACIEFAPDELRAGPASGRRASSTTIIFSSASERPGAAPGLPHYPGP